MCKTTWSTLVKEESQLRNQRHLTRILIQKRQHGQVVIRAPIAACTKQETMTTKAANRPKIRINWSFPCKSCTGIETTTIKHVSNPETVKSESNTTPTAYSYHLKGGKKTPFTTFPAHRAWVFFTLLAGLYISIDFSGNALSSFCSDSFDFKSSLTNCRAQARLKAWLALSFPPLARWNNKNKQSPITFALWR